MTTPSVCSDWQVLYICSAARCGSTLTDMFVGGHSQAASLGEVNFLGKAIALNQTCSCGASMRECENWDAVFRELEARININVRLKPYKFSLWDALAWNVVDKNRQTAGYKLAVFLRKCWLEMRYHSACMVPLLPSQRKALKNKITLYDSIARQWGRHLIVDSSKNAREAVELNRMMPGRVKVLLVTRDGRGVFLSRRKSQCSRRQSLFGWMNYYRRALPLLEKQVRDDDRLILRYEDLAANSQEVGKQLCNFLRIQFEEKMLDLDASVRHMVNGNDTRFAASKGIQLDERWKNELSGDDLDYFVEHGGEALNRCLGYV